MPSRLSRREFGELLALALGGCANARPAEGSHSQASARAGPAPSASAQTLPRPRTRLAPLAEQAELPLFERFPGLRESIPRVELAKLPTPTNKAQDLGERLGLSRLYIKRDSLSGEAYGGGKTRKLEFLLGEAVRSRATRVVTSGAVGSNHAVATAIYARQLGLSTTLLLMPQARSAHVRRNLLADLHHGAEMHLVGSQRAVALKTQRLIDRSLPERRPYVIPTGGSSPLGNVAYVNAALELQSQVRAGELPEPDRIYVPLGTMGTAAGLAIGLALTDLRSILVMVRVSNVPTSTQVRFDEMVSSTVTWLAEREASFSHLRQVQTDLRSGYLGKGYAQPTAKGRHALKLAREHGDVGLELVYTAKTFAALIDDAPSLRDQTVLFWNTHSRAEPAIGDADPHELPRELRSYF